MANALEHLLDVLQKAEVENGLCQPDVPEVALALPGFAAGLAGLVRSGHAEAEVVGGWMRQGLPPEVGLSPLMS